MFYEAELRFLRSVFKKCHIKTLLFDYENIPYDEIDTGFRKFLNISPDFENIHKKILTSVEENTIFEYKDIFSCAYMFMLLPDSEKQILLIGPFVAEVPSRKQILETAEKLAISPASFKDLENYYVSVPHLPENSHLYALLDSFGEFIWNGADNFTFKELTGSNLEQASFAPVMKKDSIDPEKNSWNIEMIEKRYEYENEMFRAVSQGQFQKAALFLSSLNSLSFEKRLADPVRNIKNYCIITNTLLRKAAQDGGVHPFYLDRISSDYALKIEQIPSTAAAQDLMADMFRSYCRLVRKHTMKHYSPPVQRAITTIDSDLTANLTLNALATMQNLSPSYLSALFSQETGQTLTEYVNQKRVKLAMRLLATTKLQIQTIAQHCGILDVHYFSKVFKKAVGVTPKQYRESQQK
ncbi:MAG: helix-turn-helix transcriptional regulator [Oscillospiraceae bacterium]|nr:helix-turn-helix transcriptional regulator [Oscillospiraceae bacterium]MBQ4117382.1 helix-turn-helix transcriptional regulator [Oscillospiraceae bacterium]